MKKQIDELLSDSSSEEVKQTKKSSKKTQPKRKQSDSESSEPANLLKNKRKASKEKASKKPVKKKQESSDESSDAPVTKKAPVKKAPVKKAQSDSESEEVKKPVKKAVKKSAKQEDSDDESVEAPKKSSRKASLKKQAKKDSSDEESDVDVPMTNLNKGAEAVEEETHSELFVKNLSWNSTQDSLWEAFGKFGEVNNVKVLTHRDTGKPKGIAFVSFEKRADAEKAMNGIGEIDGRTPGCNWSNDKKDDAPRTGNSFGRPQFGGEGQQVRTQHSGPSFTCFVGNLGFKTSDYNVKNFFARAGNVVDVRIAKDQDGRAKGFAHVDFDTEEACEKAVTFAGESLDGREIRCDKSVPRERSSGGFGGRGGFGGGRGGDRGGRGGRGGAPRAFNPRGPSGTKTNFNDSD